MIDRFWAWIDSRSVIRRAVLGVTVWLTWQSFAWAAVYAETSARPGIEVAAIIAAVTAPIAALQGHVFATYTKGRSEP